MVRVKGGISAKKKHSKVLKLAKGYWMTRHKQFKKAKEAVLHAGEYAFVGRKLKKRDFRTLWIIRLNAAVRSFGLTYSKFINSLHQKNIGLDRKILSQIAVEHPDIFSKIVEKTK
ncbi:MAG: 50S ribosomal protein L20 [Candidatus Roizmanbacteria bacterium GW2011_GWA2_36_23]|uniref:Large ribosomal subunit protein bL20 n=1 Tax=Candidatus Roizmanbacteria bacterium GW2011_GWA2_36_23 TaxID=1618480 RepID=A0A0G0GNI7_9BACT|nr:MAG: 50S ribosomal protein L20 [Candidatus Roizmanbacteria bacterium GW2011_GWA2_36_23]